MKSLMVMLIPRQKTSFPTIGEISFGNVEHHPFRWRVCRHLLRPGSLEHILVATSDDKESFLVTGQLGIVGGWALMRWASGQ